MPRRSGHEPAGDDRGDPTQAVSQARRLVEQEGVIAFFGLPAPTTGQTILSYLETKNVPALGSCICNTDVDKSPMMFEADRKDLSTSK